MRGRISRVPVLLGVLVLFGLSWAQPGNAVDVLLEHPIWSFSNSAAPTILDTRRQRLIVAAGSPGVSQTAITILDLAGPPVWQRPIVLGTPPPLVSGRAVYDSLGDRMLVFLEGSQGGVWSLSLAPPMTWTGLNPTGIKPRLDGATVVFDSGRNRVIGHGGTTGAVTLTDTWVLILDPSPAWQTLAAAGPVPYSRGNGSAVYDRLHDRMIVYGGYTMQEGGASQSRDDAWQLSFGTGTPIWSPILPPAPWPPPRQSAATILDEEHRRLVVFGGRDLSILGDTWSLPIDDVAAGWTQGPANPIPRSATSAGYDPVGLRLIVAGGRTSSLPALGDTWSLGLGSNLGPWSELLAVGSSPASPSFFAFDPDLHRFLTTALGGTDAAREATWFLSAIDTSWHPTRVVGPSPKAYFLGTKLLARFYDRASGTVWAFKPDTLYSIHPGSDTTWKATPIPPPYPPLVDELGTSFYDARRSRFLMFGGRNLGSFTRNQTQEFWALSVGAVPSWSRVAYSTPLGIRETPAIEDVRRDRLVFFGGGTSPASTSVFQPLGDLWSMDLTSLSWSALDAAGSPPSPRFHFAAGYDSLRDRVLVFGGGTFNQPSPGAYYLQFGSSDPLGRWGRNDPVGATLPGFSPGFGAIDLGRDAFLIGSDTSILDLRWGPPEPQLLMQCPENVGWSPGSILPLTFVASQTVNAARSYRWILDSQRDWPGFPLSGLVSIGSATSAPIEIGIPVPDTAGVGIDTLRFRVVDQDNPAVQDSCMATIGDPASVLLWRLLDVTIGPDRVDLTWQVAQAAQATALVERREVNGNWATAGSAPIETGGLVRFGDATVVPGLRYAYRAELSSSDSTTWSEATWVDVPAGVSRTLAFAYHGTLIARGAIDVAFTLPVRGPMRLDAFDLLGRRVASRQEADLDAGYHILRLAGAGELRSGVYFLRLTQDGDRASARALVFGGP